MSLEMALFQISRTWWVITVIVSVIFCTVSVVKILNQWNEHPVTVTFDDKTTSIADIPFPAFTVCTTQKFVDEKLDNKLIKKLFPGQFPFEIERNFSKLSADE